MNTGAPARRYDSVQQDWRSILPIAKASLFTDHAGKLENAYLMLSVSLNEAISLNQTGHFAQASQGMGVLADLCSGLALHINAVLHAMSQYARHFGIVPNLALLEPANFQSERGQRAARHSNLLCHVLLSERSQFLNKLTTLEEIVDELGDEFIESTRQLAKGISGDALRLWALLDQDHYDLTTCLRETDVLLKSFLCVLPEDHLGRFDFTVRGLARARGSADPEGSHDLIRSGRRVAAAGE